VCFFIYVATPLTLSEVRAMLPEGLRADPLSYSALAPFQHHLHTTQTVARILHGACSCDLVRQRLPDRQEDERLLRQRFAALGRSRDEIIRLLDIHRDVPPGPEFPPGHWPRALSAFAAEHARNAGPTLYYLHFDAPETLSGSLLKGTLVRVPLTEAVAHPGTWLNEDVPTLLVR
jgi:hypothetical protein